MGQLYARVSGAWVPVLGSPLPSAWANMTLQNGWGNIGGGWALAQYRKIGDIVYLRGLISRSTALTVTTPLAICTLPSGFTAGGAEIFTVNCAGNNYGDQQCRMNVGTNGGVEIVIGNTNQNPHVYVSMAGVQFSTTP